MRRFHPMDRDTDLLLPLSVQDWLSKGHLARDVVEVVEGLDLSVLVQAYGNGWPYYVCSKGNTTENCVSSRKQPLFCHKSSSKGLRRWRRSLSPTGC